MKQLGSRLKGQVKEASVKVEQKLAYVKKERKREIHEGKEA